jgi:predicted patatin/cPLA2 family phospholipase
MSLSATISKDLDTPRKTALIIEGGAMRGAWAAGVLAFLHQRGLRQYDLTYAASSGACSAAYFVAGMWQPGLSIWREHACKVVRKINFLRHKPVIDLAYLVDHVFRQHVPLSIEALQKAPTRFFIVLTDCDTGEPVYFHARDERVFDALRATSSMPLATRGYDFVDGHPFADGGIADPIPIQRAIQDGATDITVVLTHSPDLRLKPLPRWLGRVAFPEFPKVGEAWTTRQCEKYNSALALLKNPPPGIKLQVFSPVRPLSIGCFTNTQKRIEAAVDCGYSEALAQLSVTDAETVPVPSVVRVRK